MKARLLLIAALVFAAFSTANAQYSIPDCAVAQVNAITNTAGGDWFAARDQFYQQLSGEWNAQTAGLSAAQVTAYTQVYCGSLVIIDGGIEQTAEGEVWNLDWSYVTVDSWLAQGGQSSGNSQTSSDQPSGVQPTSGGPTEGSSTNTGVTSSDGTKGSGIGGVSGVVVGSDPASGSNTGPETSQQTVTSEQAAIPQIPEIIFSTELAQTFPAQLTLQDESGAAVAPEMTSNGGDGLVRIKASEYQVLTFNDGASLVDYQLDAQFSIRSGDVMLVVRGVGDLCSGYALRADPSADIIYLQRYEPNCTATELGHISDMGLGFDQIMSLRLAAQGSQLVAWFNGTEILTATDSTYTQGAPMLYILADNAGDDALVDVSAFRVVGPGGSFAPASSASAAVLVNYEGSGNDIVAELQAMGIVPSTNSVLIVSEPTAFFEGSGMWYEPLASSSPHTNIVMGAALDASFRATDTYETCSLMARIVTDGNTAVETLDAGIDSDGDVILIDSSDPNSNEFSTFEYKALGGTLDETYYFVLVAINDRVTLFVNGQPYFEDISVEARQGTYGVGLISGSPASRCEANNLWVYSFD